MSQISQYLFFLLLLFHCSFATVRSVPLEYSTIALAIAASNNGDTVRISSKPFSESITINKSITLIGTAPQSIIQGSVTISANNVTCKDFKVQGTGINGISATGISNLSLINVASYGNAVFGGTFSSIATLLITGSTFSQNGNHGLSIASCSNITLTDVVADSNSQAGIQLYNVGGSSILTNTTARKNALHGLFIYYGTTGVTVQGGTFSDNGTNQHYDGGGIAIDAGSTKTVSNIFINGPITAQNNMTAGIWIIAETSADTVKNVVVGQSGIVSLSSNNDGGVIAYGNIYSTTITGNFTKGSASAAGILLLGTSPTGTLSPQTTVINNSTFTGYISSNPAISLSSGIGKNSSANVSGSGNTFVGFADSSAIETIIFHKPDDANLGLVTLTNNNPLPVELVSFAASALTSGVMLKWETSTELNNYGFTIERKKISGDEKPWGAIGFVNGHGTSNAQQHYLFFDASVDDGAYDYRLKQIDRDGAFEYSKEVHVEWKAVISKEYSLSLYPNPFNAMTNIIAKVPNAGPVKIVLFDVSGKEIKTIYSGILLGENILNVKFDASSISSGIYYCGLYHNATITAKKLVILK